MAELVAELVATHSKCEVPDLPLRCPRMLLFDLGQLHVATNLPCCFVVGVRFSVNYNGNHTKNNQKSCRFCGQCVLGGKNLREVFL